MRSGPGPHGHTRRHRRRRTSCRLLAPCLLLFALLAAAAAGAQTLVLTADDVQTSVSIARNAAEVTEGDDVVFTLTRTQTTLALQVTVKLGGHTKMLTAATLEQLTEPFWQATDEVHGLFYRCPACHQRFAEEVHADFAAGAGTTTVTVPTQADDSNEGDGELFAEIVASDDYGIEGSARQTVLIEDGDIAVLKMQASEVDIVEGSPLLWTLERTGDASNLLMFFAGRSVTLDHPYHDVYNSPYRELWRAFGAGKATAQVVADSTGRRTFVGPAGGTAFAKILPYECGTPPCFTPRYTVGEPSSTTIRVANRFPAILVSADAASVQEGEPAVFTLTRVWNPENLADETTVAVFGVTQEGGVIDGTPPTMVTFAPGETTKPLSIPTLEDLVAGGGGSVTVRLEGPDDLDAQTIEGAYVVLARETVDGEQLASATVAVVEDDGSPSTDPDAEQAEAEVTASFGAATYVAAEGGSPATVTVRLSGPLEQQVEIPLQASNRGGAVAGDYSAPAKVVFGADVEVRTITVTATDDALDEGAESVVLSFGTLPATVGEGDPAAATVTLEDDDPTPTVTLALAPTAIAEDGGKSQVTASLSGASSLATTVTVSASALSPAVAGDFELSANTVLTIAAAATDSTGEVTITALNNAVDAAAKRVAVQGTAENGFGVNGPADVNLTLEDDDQRGVTVTPTALPIAEGGSASYTVALTSQPTGPVTVAAAIAGDLFVRLAADVAVAAAPRTTTLTFAPASWDTAQTVTVRAYPDLDVQDDAASVAHTVAGADYAANGVTADQVAVTVADDGEIVTYELVLPVAPVAESAGTLAIDVIAVTNRAVAPQQDYVLAVSSYRHSAPEETRDSFTADPGIDFGTLSEELQFAASGFKAVAVDGEQRYTQTVSFAARIRDDELAEAAETFPITLEIAAGYGHVSRLGADWTTTITILDDDAAPEVAGAALAVAEGVTEVATLTATDADLGDGALQWEIPSGAGGGADAAQFTLAAAGVLAFKAAKDYENPDDADGDGAYELTVQVSDGHNPVTAALTVTLTDVVPEVTIAADAGQATEGDTVGYTVTRSGDLSGALSVTVTVSEAGGAVLASGEAGARQVAFSGTAATAAVSVATVDDTVDEPDATVTATLTAAAGYTVGTDASAAVTVADDEELEVTVTGPASVAEGAAAPFTVTLAGGTSAAPAAVSYTVAGTATPGTDYTAPGGTLTLAAGAAAGTISVATLDDAVLDPGETLKVTLDGATTAARTVAVSGSPATTTIVDDGTVTVSVATATATEGAELAFTVALTGTVAAEVALGWSTADATAAAGDDYTAVSGGTLTIAGGRTAAALTVATVEDTLAEAAETFTVTLAAPAAGLPAGVSLGTASATGTIADDDPLTASVSAAAATVMEGEAASFAVALSGGTSTAAVAVAYTVGGTATVGDDYAAPAGTLTLAAGAAAGTITIATRRDEQQDPSETLEVTLSGASTAAGTVRVDPAAARTTIANEGTELVLGEVRALLEPATVTEGEVAQFAVTLSGTVTAAGELSWTTINDGTATAGDDYTAASGTLTFLPDGVTTQTIEVATAEDALAEETETFSVGMGTAKVTGAIEDDDHAPAITGTALTVAENQTAVATLAASDADGDELTWSIPSGTAGGADAAQFTLAAAGLLAFKEAKDYENPDDADGDGDYELTVQVSDGHNPVTAALTVTLTDVVPEVTIAAAAGEATEGDTLAYTVTRSGDLSGALSVTVTVSEAGGAVLASGEAGARQVAFSGTAATAAVSVATEDDAVDEPDATVTATLTAATGYTTGTDASAAVTVTDNDTAGIVLTPTALQVTEGESATYTVELATEPSGQVTVTVGGADGTDLSVVSGGSLTFTASTWNTAQTVAVRAGEDDDGSDDSATLTHTGAGGGYGSVTEDLPVTVTDNDTAAIVLSPTTLRVTEGRNATYTVELATEPSGQVTVTVGDTTGTDLSVVSGGSLTFTDSTWNTAHTVAVSAGEDDDGANDSATLSHTGAGGGYGAVTEDLPVTVTDNDTAEIVLSPTTLRVTEGGDATYMVELATEPSGQVTVTVDGADGTDLTVVNGSSLTFTDSTWNTAQTVAVSAGEDDDGANDSATLTHTASGADYGSVTEDLQVTVTDDDTAAIVLSPTTLRVTEGSNATYTVELATEPSGQVTVTVGGADGTDLSVVSGGSLTFTDSTWNTAQTVEVRAGEDDDGSDDSATLSYTGAGGGYGAVTEDLPVTVTDNDTAAIVLSPTTLRVTEGGDATYMVELATEPSGQVTVTVDGADGTDLTVVNGSSLTFTDSTWNTAQTVEVRAGEDDDASEDSATLSHTAVGADYGSVTEDLPVTVTDNDTAGIVLTPTALGVTEGSSATYTVELATEPSGQVTVTVDGANGTDLTVVNGSSLTFTASTWNTAQTVKVRAGEDDDASNDSATLSHTAVGADYGSVTEDLPVTVADDDTAGIVLTPTSLGVTEGGSATYTVELSTQPSGQVTVTVGGASGTDLSVVSGGSLTFTDSTWNTAQTVEVRADEDDDASNDSATLTHTGSGADYGSVTKGLPVTITDSDTAGILLTPTTLRVTEGSSATYTVELSTQPSGQVTVTVGGASGTDLTVVNGGSLTFTDSTWNTAQTVEVRAGEDDDGANDSATLSHTGSGADYGSVTEDLPVTVTDNDTAGIVLTPTTLRVTEGGSATYTVELATEPSGQVTVTVGGASGTDVTVVNGGSLTFTDSTWNTAQTVEVRAGEDDDASEDSATLSHTAVGADYGSVTEDLPVTVTDNDTAGIVLTPTTLGVTEGGSATYTVELATEPSGQVTVTVGGASGTDVTVVNGGSLTFTDSTWNTAQTVAVSAGEDDDGTNDSATLSHTASDADYGSVTEDLPVTVTDNDSAGIVLTPTSLGVTEGSSATYTVELSTQPSGEVTVTVGGTSGTDLTVVNGGSLTFTASTWNTAQTVEVRADEDDDGSDDSATLSHTAAGADYGSVTRNLPVTVTDNDTASTGVGLSLNPDSIAEGAGGSAITVTGTLNTVLVQEVTVTVSVTGETAAATDFAAVAPVTLTIVAGQSTGTAVFTVTPVDDELDEGDETVRVGGTASLPDLAVAAATLTIGDDDARGVTVHPTELTMRPDEHKTYTVRLNSEPTATAVVEVIVPEGGDLEVTVAPRTLTFTPAAWKTAQTVGVTASRASDAVGSAQRLDLEHAVSGGDYDRMPAEPVALSISDDATTDAPQRDAPSPPPPSAPPPPPPPPRPPTVSISADAETVAEGTPARFTVRRSRGSANPLTVTVGVTERGSFIAGAPPTQVTIAAHARTATLQVATDDDSIDEPDGAVTATLAAGAGYALGGSAGASVTITDNDAAPEFTVADLRAVESAGQLEFTVELSAVSGWQVTVAYATAGRTATEDEDYTATSGVLTFATGQSPAQTIAVPILDDTLDETDETFALRLSGARHATLAGGEATLAAAGTIEDDDEPAVSIAAAAATVAEGSAARFTVTRHGITAQPLTVTVGVTERGSFIAGAPPTQVTIAAHARTATLLVATEDDATDEPDGTVTAAVMAAAGYVTGEPASATVTVTDDDAAPELTIADVRAVESTGAIEFTVRMAAASGHEVTVSCTSADGTATADEDYVAEVGTLALAPGQTGGTIRIALLDDMVDEADETFTMVLADAVNARLVDGIAVGTIVDDDAAVAQAWLARFGRTVATHVMEAIDGRLAAGAGPGAQASVAGRRLQPAADLARAAGAEAVPVRRLEFRELLAGSSFHLTLSAAQESAHESGVGSGERWTAWGRGAATQLAGVEGKLSLGGQVASAVAGADYDWGRLVTGLSVAYSDGGGEFTVRGSGTQQERTGDLQSWLLSAHPYASVKLTDRLEIWGLLGYGLGRMSLAESGAAAETEIALLMSAFGGRGVLLSRAQDGVELTVKTDGLVLRVSGEEAAGLPAVTADVQRVRVVLEGALDLLRGPAGVLTPSLQVGARYDGGAAETGAGLEVGGGVSYAYPAWGLTLAASGRLLVTHQDRGYEEWGAGGSLRLQPGAAGLGPSLSVNTAWGEAASGVEQLWSQGAGRAAGGAGGAPAGRLAAELGYGIAAPGGQGLVTPYAGVTLANGGAPAYRVGGRMSLGQSFSLELQVDRREAAGAAPEHGLKLNASLRW